MGGAVFPPCYLKVKVKVRSLSHVRLFATQTPWTVAHQAPLSMGFSRQEYWSGLPFPSPRDHPDLGIEFKSPTLQAEALTSEPPGKPPVIYLGPNYGGGNEHQKVPCIGTSNVRSMNQGKLKVVKEGMARVMLTF